MGSKLAFQQLIEDTRQTFTSARPFLGCPASETLVEYVYGNLAGKKEKEVQEHLDFCESCRMVYLRIKADELLWNDMLEQDPGVVLGQALGENGRKTVNHIISIDDCPEKQRTSRIISKIPEKLISWISPVWMPLYAGETVTASDVEEQSTNFEMDYGEYINLSCHWHEEKNEQACIELSWQANLLQPSRLWARFINPENSAIMTEILLGKQLEGSLCIPEEKLNFNPTSDKWAIAIIVEDD